MFDGRYSLWGGEHSLFTRKLQAMLNYLDVDYEFCLKTEHARAEVEGRLGNERAADDHLVLVCKWIIHNM